MCTAILISFLCAFTAVFFLSVIPGYADNHADEEAASSALYINLQQEALSELNKLSSIADTDDESELKTAQEACLKAYEACSALFDKADEAYDNGLIDNSEYASIIEMLNDIGDSLSLQFERFGFDPYAVDLAYRVTLNSNSISRYIPTYEWSSYYNGSNIIIDFNIKFLITDAKSKLNYIYIGGNGQLLKVDARGYNHATSDPSVGAQYFSSEFGSVTLTSILMNSKSTEARGYITVTNPSGLNSWYTGGDRSIWFTDRSDSSTDYEYFPDSSTGMNPTVISNYEASAAQGLCTHNYVCTAIDGSSHRTACSSCGYVLNTGAHNDSVRDTSSKPGYTVVKCSACGYIRSSYANTYRITIDMGTGNASDNVSVSAVYGSNMPDINIPSRSGYTFLGVYTGQNGTGTRYYSETGKGSQNCMLTSDSTLYACWKQSCEVKVSDTVRNEFACTGA